MISQCYRLIIELDPSSRLPLVFRHVGQDIPAPTTL